MGLLVCGGNGSGKSTLGRALAEALHVCFLDSEALYFPEGQDDNPFAAPRTEAEFLAVLEAETREPDFVFASVKGNCGPEIRKRFSLAVWIDVPREIRLSRVRERSFRRFGARMLPGGDLYETEERFFARVAARSDEEMRAWVERLACPVLRVDGTRPVQDLVQETLRWVSDQTKEEGDIRAEHHDQ